MVHTTRYNTSSIDWNIWKRVNNQEADPPVLHVISVYVCTIPWVVPPPSNCGNPYYCVSRIQLYSINQPFEKNAKIKQQISKPKMHSRKSDFRKKQKKANTKSKKNATENAKNKLLVCCFFFAFFLLFFCFIFAFCLLFFCFFFRKKKQKKRKHMVLLFVCFVFFFLLFPIACFLHVLFCLLSFCFFQLLFFCICWVT